MQGARFAIFVSRTMRMPIRWTFQEGGNRHRLSGSVDRHPPKEQLQQIPSEDVTQSGLRGLGAYLTGNGSR